MENVVLVARGVSVTQKDSDRRFVHTDESLSQVVYIVFVVGRRDGIEIVEQI
jgi:hypothetical protein